MSNLDTALAYRIIFVTKDDDFHYVTLYRHRDSGIKEHIANFHVDLDDDAVYINLAPVTDECIFIDLEVNNELELEKLLLRKCTSERQMIYTHLREGKICDFVLAGV